MKTIYNHLEADDLMYALFEHGGDAMIIEDEETAQDIAELLNSAEHRSEVEDDRDEDPENGWFAVAMRQLDIEPDCDVKHIYKFTKGSAGTVCFRWDYE